MQPVRFKKILNRNINNITCDTLKGWSSRGSIQSSQNDSPAAAYDKSLDSSNKIKVNLEKTKRINLTITSGKVSESSADYPTNQKAPVLISTFKYE